MSHFNQITKRVTVAGGGGSTRVWDSPYSSPVKDLTIIVTGEGGDLSNITKEIFFGGYFIDGSSNVVDPYTENSTLEGGVSQGSAVSLGTGTTASHVIYRNSGIFPLNSPSASSSINMPISVNFVNTNMNPVNLEVTFISNQVYDTNILYQPDQIVNVSNNTFYVSTLGNDSFGDGTLSNPYATIEKVLEYIPHYVEGGTSYIIKIANGTYENFPNIGLNLGVDSLIIIDGYEQPVEDHATEYTISTIDSGDAFATINLGSAVFTSEEHYGKYLLITSGTSVGYYFPIFKNGVDTVITSNMLGYLVSNGDKFKIVVPGVTFVNNKMSKVDITGQESSSVLFNIGITNDSSYGDELLSISGTSNFVFFCSSIKKSSGSVSTLAKLFTSRINSSFVVSDAIKTNLSYLSFISEYPFSTEDYLFYICSLVVYDSNDPHPVTDLVTSFSDNSNINSIFVKGSILFYDGSLVLEGVLCSRLELLKTHGECILSSLGIFQDGEHSEFLRISEFSSAKLNYCQMVGSADCIINIIENSNIVKINNSDFSNASADYFINVGFSCKVFLYEAPTSTNSVNDIYLVRSASASAFPLAGSSVNDGECSYLALRA